MKHVYLFPLFLLVFIAIPVVGEAHTQACTMQYDPVCGTKGGQEVTYGNSCVLSAEGATLVHKGECADREVGVGAGPSGYVPPATCTAWFDGCNRCTRQSDGSAACTLMACMGEPNPGYCTAYENSAPPSVHPTPEVPTVAMPNEATSSPAQEATTTPERPGFFVRIWTSVASWFGGLF